MVCAASSRKYSSKSVNIFQSLPQGRDINLVSTKPKVEVIPKFTFCRQGSQVPICCRNDPGIAHLGNVGANLIILPLLQQPEQLYLGTERQVADFIEKQGSPGSLGNEPTASLLRSGKGTFFVAKKSI